MTKKTNCKKHEINEMAKEIADIDEQLSDLNKMRMEQGLTAYDKERGFELNVRKNNLKRDIIECGENPIQLLERGRKLNKEESEEENADSDEKEYYNDPHLKD